MQSFSAQQTQDVHSQSALSVEVGSATRFQTRARGIMLGVFLLYTYNEQTRKYFEVVVCVHKKYFFRYPSA